MKDISSDAVHKMCAYLELCVDGCKKCERSIVDENYGKCGHLCFAVAEETIQKAFEFTVTKP